MALAGPSSAADRPMVSSSPLATASMGEKRKTALMRDLLKLENLTDVMGPGMDTRFRGMNLELLLLAFVGILLMVAELQVAWRFRDTKCDPNPNDGVDDDLDPCVSVQDADGNTELLVREEIGSNGWTQGLKGLIAVSSFWLVWRVWCYYKLVLLSERKKHHMMDPVPLHRSTHLWPFLAELIVCVLHPFPFLNFTTSWSDRPFINDKVGVWMFARLYLVFRVIRDHSAIYRKRRRLKAAGGDKLSAIRFNWWLTIKYIFFEHSVVFVVSLTTVFIFIISYSVYVMEREFQPENFTFGNSVWFTCVTMTTVGYGDLAPISSWGRGVASIGAVFGIILTALLIGVIVNHLTLTIDQRQAVQLVLEHKIQEDEKILAARVIQLAWRHFRGARDREALGRTENSRRRAVLDYYSQSMKVIESFRRVRRQRFREQVREASNPTVNHIVALDKRFVSLEERVDALLGRTETLLLRHARGKAGLFSESGRL